MVALLPLSPPPSTLYLAALCLSVHISHTDPIAIETVPLCYFYCEANVIKVIVVIYSSLTVLSVPCQPDLPVLVYFPLTPFLSFHP